MRMLKVSTYTLDLRTQNRTQISDILDQKNFSETRHAGSWAIWYNNNNNITDFKFVLNFSI